MPNTSLNHYVVRSILEGLTADPISAGALEELNIFERFLQSGKV